MPTRATCMPEHRVGLCRNAIRTLQIDGATLVAHDDKVTALTTYYFDILGGSATTSWLFDLLQLYEGGERADLVAPFAIIT